MLCSIENSVQSYAVNRTQMHPARGGEAATSGGVNTMLMTAQDISAVPGKGGRIVIIQWSTDYDGSTAA